MISRNILIKPARAAGPLYEPGPDLPKHPGGRALGQPVDISPQPVGSPVHSLCTTPGDEAGGALSNRDFVVPTCGGRKKCLHKAENTPRVSKPSPGGVAVPTLGRHAFQVDQREWDYGARMSRDRRAADPWTTRSPESPDFADPEAKWSSLTDTGSLQPSDEALDWQRRADAWAQQAESDPSQSVEPANRWSDVAATGRPTFPADGVGWRTETAEWRATGARWRQTTEWRSTTGSHVWRSTTEAWQTGGNSAHPSDAETPMAQPAISSSAWAADDDQEADTRLGAAEHDHAELAAARPAPAGRELALVAEPGRPATAAAVLERASVLATRRHRGLRHLDRPHRQPHATERCAGRLGRLLAAYRRTPRRRPPPRA